MSKIQDISDIFTEAGKAKLKKRQLLVFEKDGKKTSYRIVSLSGGVFVREINTVTDEEMNAHDGHEIDATDNAVKMFGAPYCNDCKVVIGPEIEPEQLGKFP